MNEDPSDIFQPTPDYLTAPESRLPGATDAAVAGGGGADRRAAVRTVFAGLAVLALVAAGGVGAARLLAGTSDLESTSVEGDAAPRTETSSSGGTPAGPESEEGGVAAMATSTSVDPSTTGPPGDGESSSNADTTARSKESTTSEAASRIEGTSTSGPDDASSTASTGATTTVGSTAPTATAPETSTSTRPTSASTRPPAQPPRLATPDVSMGIHSSNIDAFWSTVAGADQYRYRVTINGEEVHAVTSVHARMGYRIGSRTGEVCVRVTALGSDRPASREGSACRTVVAETTPLSPPQPTSQIHGSRFSAVWAAVTGADSYRWRATVNGEQVTAGTTVQGNAGFDFGTGTGEVCIHVSAHSSGGRPPSTEGSNCRTVQLPTPAASARIDGSMFVAGWQPVAGAEWYEYRVALDGRPLTNGTTGGTTVSHPVDSRTGRFCLYVTAHAPGRASPVAGMACADVAPG